MIKKILKTFVLCFFFLIWVQNTDAAVIYLAPEGTEYNVGEEFFVGVKIDSDVNTINAAQATINFPTDKLEVVGIDDSESIFNFWLDDPDYSNDTGKVSFIGGTTKPVSGGSLHVLKIKFETKVSDSAELTIENAGVTAADGEGTNILSAIQGVSVGVEVKALPKEQLEAAILEEEVETPIVVERPVKVTREPVIVGARPSAPELRIPLYPEQNKWYNYLGETIVLWDLPDDVIKVAALIDRNPNTVPPVAEEELFNGKNFGFLDDGIWYAHVQFRNNVGWGGVAHYKIQIDTMAPLVFEVTTENLISDNPRPVFNFETSDSLSGVEEYVISLNNQKIDQTDSISYILPLQKPGNYSLSVCAKDKAGNSAERFLDFEILPLPTPIINFITKSISPEEFIFASGVSDISNASLDIVILKDAGEKGEAKIFEGEIESDELGNWEFKFDRQLPRGEYGFTISVKDERGAVSNPSEVSIIKVRPNPIFVVGGLEVGWFELLLIIALLVVVVVVFGIWKFYLTRGIRESYKIILGRDINKFTNLLSTQLKDLHKTCDSLDIKLEDKTQMEVLFKKINDTTERIKKHLLKEVEKIK